MAHPYNQIYLNDAMQNMAEAVDVAKKVYGFELNFFMHLFISSGLSYQFELGNPKYIVGKSGVELVEEIVYRTYGAFKIKECNGFYINPGSEYWAGWVLEYYHWRTGKTFKEIQNIISLEELHNYYNPYHEMDEEKLVEFINSKDAEEKRITRLQTYRKYLGLSQSELAKESDVNIRTLQQYEIGAKDLGKASANTILALSKVLKCNPEDIL